MTFQISGEDYSPQVSSYRLKPRRITGSARGTLLNGDTVADLIITKWDLTVGFESSDETIVHGLLTTFSGEYIQLTFSDPVTNTDITGFFEPQVNSVDMALDKGEANGTTSRGKRYWYGFTVNLTAK